MKFKIETALFNKYPNLRIGVVVGNNLTITRDNPELKKLTDENIKKFLAYMDGKEILQESNIEAWRETYRSFGVKPKKHQPTAEALLRRVLKRKAFPVINTAVNSYLAVELLYLLPIGGYDLEKLNGEIVLRVSPGNELFHPLGGDKEEITNTGEIIYADNQHVLTRRWNYRDAEHCKITLNSKNIILVSEAALQKIKTDDLTKTIDRIIEYERRFCGGSYKKYYLDTDTREVEL